VLNTLPKKSTGPTPSQSNSRINRLVRRNLETDSEAEDDLDVGSHPLRPWMVEYERYINTHDVIPSRTSIIAWWGVSLF
jgi:hypothetical protein